MESLIKKGHTVRTLVPYNPDNTWGWIDTFEPYIKKNLEEFQEIFVIKI